LAKELQKEFPGDRGYSARNLWFMRQFYMEYSNLEPQFEELMGINLKTMISEVEVPNLPPLITAVSWTKNLAIIQKCKDYLERIFYIKAARRFGWTHDVLVHNIDSKAYERYLTNQTNFDDAVPEKYRLQAKLAVKDEYNFSFLEVGEEHSEAELEAAIMKNLRILA